MSVILKLSISDAERLEEILDTTYDEGCGGDVWQSSELSRLACDIQAQLKVQKEPRHENLCDKFSSQD